MPEQQLQLEHAEPRQGAPLTTRPRVGRIRGRLASLPTAYRSAPEEISEGSRPEAGYRRDATYRWSLALADLLSAVIAVVIGVVILGEAALNPLTLLALPLVLVAGKLSGLYRHDEYLVRKSTLNEVPTLFWVATLYALLIWLASDVIVEGTFGREQAVGVWALLFVSMLATRALARSVARAISAEERCLVIGDADTAGSIARRFDHASGLGARVVGRVPLEPEAPSSNGVPVLGNAGSDGVSVLGDAAALRRVLKEQRVERAIIAPNGTVSDDLLNTILRLKSLGMQVSVLPRLLEVVGSSAEVDDVDGITLLGMHRYGLGPFTRAVKRTLDVVGAGLGLLVLAPLVAAIAIAIKLDSRGPVFFRQRRMGQDGVPFEMLKFRTMVDGADARKSALAAQNQADGGLFKIDDDPRITRVGGPLRHASLDELPQLFNVLRGEMSLVGPRPLVLDEDSMIEGWRRARLELPPGMTGPWQVFGSARIPMHEMVKIDYLYGANWSLWLDLKILLRTVLFVFGRRGL